MKKRGENYRIESRVERRGDDRRERKRSERKEWK